MYWNAEINTSPHNEIFDTYPKGENVNTHLFILILAVVCFTIGAFTKAAPSDINWTNAGLAFVTLSLII